MKKKQQIDDLENKLRIQTEYFEVLKKDIEKLRHRAAFFEHIINIVRETVNWPEEE